ncbi:MAG: AzlC family ABC transporter permease [Shimia sp.]
MDARAKTLFWQGIVAGLPFLFVIVPFGLLFGVLATEAGLDLAAVMGMTVLVIAGSAQFTAVQLMAEDAPILIVLATALAVNLRMAMYSAALVPYLGQAGRWHSAAMAYLLVDQSFAVCAPRFEAEGGWDLRDRMAFFFGVLVPVAPFWYGATWAGAVLGARIPDWMALDFALPLCFLTLIGPALRTAAHVAAAGTSAAVALALAWIPYQAGLLVAAVVAMAVGARVELWREARA